MLQYLKVMVGVLICSMSILHSHFLVSFVYWKKKLAMFTTYIKTFFTISNVLIHVGGLFEINLDRRKLKTPGGKLFTVPNEALAIAVATEWDAQKDTLKFYTMHLVW